MEKNEKLEALKDLRFTLTNEMQETIFEMLVIQQMLNENELSYRERKQLEKHKEKLLEHFRDEFQKHNVQQVAIYRAFMDE